MNKINKLLLYMILPISMDLNAAQWQELFNTPWQFIEDCFITVPENKANSFLALSARGIIPTAVGTLVAYKTYGATAQRLNNNPWVRKSLTAASGLIPAALSYHIITHLIKKGAELKSLRRFILSWNDVKHFTPKQLHGVCNELSRLINENPAKYKEMAPEAVRLIKKTIFEQFPVKYAHKLKALDRDFFDTRNLLTLVTFDLGNTLRGIADIIRANAGR